ncbi:Putative glycosyltransferase 34, nucleotide-diphospho-sugar transferase [Septoria linicola]|uniref:Glycosyltransferase 34, nucleotide-diphospho-sugar transferase n=1 Tax=Septoria linicola TaxID=215465 RepID=A0A9Q9AHT3_9PEZI|nr:putative glycosyltransferase 34, nucleotide-diphospho-sugar transferase [Septoria linicola]USW49654.1 Putative glycosyltransferase 34, nucleotide-diphospho-sugar transferase [Septoria linicola]
MTRMGTIDRGRLILITAFILQAFTAYHFGARSVAVDISEIKDVEDVFHYVSPKDAPADATMTCRPTSLTTTTRPKFVMGSMSDRETSYDWLVISNKNLYAAKQSYDIVWDFERNDKYGKDWDRLTSMEKIIKAKLRGENDYEWIWWTDYDLIITNSSITLENVVDGALARIENKAHRSEIDIIMTPDCFPMNSGSLLVRTTQWSLDWIREMWRQGEIETPESGKRSLQDCLGDMVKEDTNNINRKGTFVKQYEMNAFPPEIKCHEDGREWQKGDFVIHMAGAWAHVEGDDPTGRLLRKYASFVV